MSKGADYEKEKYRWFTAGTYGFTRSDSVSVTKPGTVCTKNVAELLNHLFEKKNISKAALAKQSGMSEIYLHQIFAGRRNPSRNRLLCLCYGLDASVEETQELLKRCGKAQLYPKLKRDAIIYYGLLHKLDLFEINDKLFDENEETLF